MTKTTFKLTAFGVSVAAIIGVAGYAASSEHRHSSDAQKTARSEFSSATISLPRQPLIVHGDGALIAPYFVPSLKEFEADPYVVGVIEGRVTDAMAEVSEDQNTVNTVVTVEVSQGWGTSESTIKVVEPGGVVPLRDVRSQFEGKEWQKPLTDEDLGQQVDYQMEGFPHTHIGDHVVMFLADRSAKEGIFNLAAGLTVSPDGQGYTWPGGDSPNPEWPREFSDAEVTSYLQRK